MGLKVNIFVGCILLHGIVYSSFNTLSLFSILASFTLLYKDFKVWQYTKKFPGTNFPIHLRNYFGTTNGEQVHREIFQLWTKYGRDKFVTWIGLERYVTVSRLSDIRTVLQTTDDGILMDKCQQLWPWLGGDLMKTDGFSSSSLVRALTDGTFYNYTQSDAFKITLNKRLQVLCQHIAQRMDNVDVQALVRAWTFDIIYGLATGQEPQKRREIFDVSECLCQLADQRSYSGWRQSTLLLNLMGEHAKWHGAYSKLIKAISEDSDQKSGIPSLLDTLKQENLNDDQCYATTAAFIVLGYDRLATSVTCALMELSKSQENTKIILNEIKSNNSENGIKLNALSSLNELLTETQRFHPATSIISKWITDCVPLNGYFIPPNTSVLIYLYGTGRINTNTDKFDMMRRDQLDIYGGVDSLPMTITKAIVAHVINSFHLNLGKGEVTMANGITLRPKNLKLSVSSL